MNHGIAHHSFRRKTSRPLPPAKSYISCHIFSTIRPQYWALSSSPVLSSGFSIVSQRAPVSLLKEMAYRHTHIFAITTPWELSCVQHKHTGIITNTRRIDLGGSMQLDGHYIQVLTIRPAISSISGLTEGLRLGIRARRMFRPGLTQSRD